PPRRSSDLHVFLSPWALYRGRLRGPTAFPHPPALSPAQNGDSCPARAYYGRTSCAGWHDFSVVCSSLLFLLEAFHATTRPLFCLRPAAPADGLRPDRKNQRPDSSSLCGGRARHVPDGKIRPGFRRRKV